DRGGPVRIAYFGGSITAAPGWRVKTLAWFRETWPRAEITETNAAIGGTGSDLGVFRCSKDVLASKPDLIFVEFSVNDGGAPPEQIHRTMEGIVRQTRREDPETDICFVYTFRVGYEKQLLNGLCPRATSAHERVAAHYGIPSINMALRIVELEREGKLVYKAAPGEAAPEGRTLFSRDGVHPLKEGHAIYARVIADAMRVIGKA
ncbi:MAG: SGNH/GDSL hydrolase family protein, partial [Planctomycetota bacterium]